ncbi:MAG: 50S ribosomal protein L1 [Candidatus Dormibacteraceae bacterium]
MAKQHGKLYQDAAKRISEVVGERAQGLAPEAACQLVRETAGGKFDATVELHVRLGVDPRHADQMVRGSVVLPHGTGKTVRVLCFVAGDKVTEAREAGADYVGGDDLVKKIEGGWTDFDVAVATPDMMPKVGPLGRILGPRGLMPNPKTGTVTSDIGRAIAEVKAGRIEFRTDRWGIIHSVIGKASFEEERLRENLTALIDELMRNKPSAAKGQYLKTMYLAATMGPSVPIDVQEAAKLASA